MKKLTLITAIFFISGIAHSQNTNSQLEDFNNITVVSPASSSFQNEEISISWTLGNTLYTLSESNTLDVPAELDYLNLIIKAYPNPTKSNLIIESNTLINESLNIVLFDVNGRKLKEKRMSEKINILSLKHLPSALYVIKIVNSKNQLIKTFKIVKD